MIWCSSRYHLDVERQESLERDCRNDTQDRSAWLGFDLAITALGFANMEHAFNH